MWIAAIPGLDLTAGLRSVGDRKATYERLLRLFVSSHEQAFFSLRHFLVEGDAGEARRLVHSLKGSAATLGAIKLREAAAELEKAILGEQDSQEIDRLISLTEVEHETLLAAIRALPVEGLAQEGLAP